MEDKCCVTHCWIILVVVLVLGRLESVKRVLTYPVIGADVIHMMIKCRRNLVLCTFFNALDYVGNIRSFKL
jgi:hypothetical protein